MHSEIQRLIDNVKIRGDMVPLTILRQIHKDWSRAKFDRLVKEARRLGKLTATAYEGRHGITKEEQEAGILEDGFKLGFLSVRY